ncbi:sigma-70 family RNA polymerase sigma factor [Sphingorhabdus sp.]|uniref:sigma-70 family RNA polymerase sigma factor n=1 Tax=Sphingorhabdus sp. TaxID=1902408 RepID=UPI0039837620
MNIDPGTIDLDSARRAKLAEALVKAGRGDRNAFATVYAATSAKLFGVCLRIFPDRNEAEDVLQDAYLTIWNKAASFESGRASPISWLVAVTRNRAIDRLRAKKKAGTTSIEEAAEIADATPLADVQLIEEADDRILHDCISSLDKRDALFIRSAFIGGSTYADLAKHEGQPLGTVKSRIRRALMKLRGCMEGAA